MEREQIDLPSIRHPCILRCFNTRFCVETIPSVPFPGRKAAPHPVSSLQNAIHRRIDRVSGLYRSRVLKNSSALVHEPTWVTNRSLDIKRHGNTNVPCLLILIDPDVRGSGVEVYF